jgi:hypothetical protein
MRFGTWNVRSLYRAGSITAAARELAYQFLVGLQEVRWDRQGTVRAGEYNLFYGKITKIINWEQDYFTPQNNIRS